MHQKNIFKSGELVEDSVTEKNSATAADGKNYMTKFYNLDVIISVGFRVNSIRATQFRQWYEFYNQRFVIWQQPVAKLVNDEGQQLVAQLGNNERKQPVAPISEDVFFSVPWGHHLYIISQCKDVDRAVFYLNTNCQSSCLKTYKASCLPSKI